MIFFDNILNFVTDSNKRLSAKTTVVVLALLSIVFIDNVTGFSYYYNNQQQLDQLKSITALLNDTTLTNSTRIELIELQKQTFKRKNIIDNSISFFNTVWINTKQTEIINKEDENARNNILFLISTSGIYILVTIILIPVMLLTDKKTPFLKLVATLIIFTLIMFFSSWFNYWFFDIILPDRIFGNWLWNYIINFAIQLILLFSFYWVVNTINKSDE